MDYVFGGFVLLVLAALFFFGMEAGSVMNITTHNNTHSIEYHDTLWVLQPAIIIKAEK